MKISSAKTRGFTLIELLVVISIIALLSAIVLASLQGARQSGHDAAIEETAHSMMEQAEADSLATGNWNAYTVDGASGYINTAAQCVAANNANNDWLSSSNPSAMTAGCQSIMNLEGGATGGAAELFYQAGWGNSTVPANPRLSYMIWLPHKQVYLCVGSDGQTSMITPANGIAPGYPTIWSAPGCAADGIANGS